MVEKLENVFQKFWKILKIRGESQEKIPVRTGKGLHLVLKGKLGKIPKIHENTPGNSDNNENLKQRKKVLS